MKIFILLVAAFCLAGFASQSYAQDQVVVTRRKTVTFKCITPADFIKGVGYYAKDVGDDVLKGAGRIISAPFRARIYIPKARFYKWERGHWVPNKFYEVPRLKIEGGEMRYLPYYDGGSTNGYIAFYTGTRGYIRNVNKFIALLNN